VTAIVQNTTPYTYFAQRPIDLAEDVALDDGTIAGVVLHRAWPSDMPTVAWRALSPRARILKHRRVEGFAGVTKATIRSLDERGLPLQVDGDYLGELPEIALRVDPGALRVVS
jgi:diacylglycerol kinase family enzyme